MPQSGASSHVIDLTSDDEDTQKVIPLKVPERRTAPPPPILSSRPAAATAAKWEAGPAGRGRQPEDLAGRARRAEDLADRRHRPEPSERRSWSRDRESEDRRPAWDEEAEPDRFDQPPRTDRRFEQDPRTSAYRGYGRDYDRRF
jgi:hypothetical protein